MSETLGHYLHALEVKWTAPDSPRRASVSVLLFSMMRDVWPSISLFATVHIMEADFWNRDHLSLWKDREGVLMESTKAIIRPGRRAEWARRMVAGLDWASVKVYPRPGTGQSLRLRLRLQLASWAIWFRRRGWIGLPFNPEAALQTTQLNFHEFGMWLSRTESKHRLKVAYDPDHQRVYALEVQAEVIQEN